MVLIGLVLVAWWIAVGIGLPIYIAGQQGSHKNRNGYAWGIIFGWIGVIALCCLPQGNYKTEQ